MIFLKKMAFYASLMLAVILFSFILFHTVPSDPARLILGPNADEQRVMLLQEQLGLNKPLRSQLVSYLSNLSHLNLGRSYIDQRPVINEVANSFKISIVLVLTSLIIVIIYSFFSILLIPHRLPVNKLNFLLISTPTFFSGIVIALIAIKFYPYDSFSGKFNSYRDYFYFIPPAFALSLYPMGILTNLLAKELNKILSSPYILAARAYSVPRKKLLFKYALRNGIVPYMASLSNQLPSLFTGAFILEIIFSIPGTGALLVKSIFAKDFPMIEGVIILNGLVFILINFFFESAYPYIDPRIKS